jgi:hypothetical protein
VNPTLPAMTWRVLTGRVAGTNELCSFSVGGALPTVTLISKGSGIVRLLMLHSIS